VVESGLIRESHIINHGAQDLTLAASRAMGITVAQAEERKRKFGLKPVPENSIKQSLELTLGRLSPRLRARAQGYEQAHNQSLSRVVLTGGGATLKGLRSLCRARYKTSCA
jgi:Tfp pilus assembly PilM family ATPase